MAGILIFPLQPGEIVCRPGVQCCFLNFEIPILKFTDQVNAAANIFLYRLVSSGKIVSKAAVYNRGKSVLSSIGIIIAADGIYKIKVALDARSLGHEKWGLIVVVSLFTIVFGFSLIINSGEVTTALIMLIGISLLIDGAQNLITIISTFKLMSTLVLKEDAANAEFKEEDIPQAESDDVKAEEIRPEDMIIEDKKEDGE